MKLLIDDANLSNIKRLFDLYAIDGVTTNPSILAKTLRKPYDVLCELREYLGPDGELHVQVISSVAQEMVREAACIKNRVGESTFIKIPAVPEGIKAIKELSIRGYHTTATAVYTPMQAFMAAKAGADYVAPYVNRIDNLGGSGVTVVSNILDMFRNNHFKTQILAASFKNIHQVESLCRLGVDTATVAPAVIDTFLQNESVHAAIKVFVSDFERLCGAGHTMLDS